MTRRTDRVNDLLQEEISDLIHHELKDPRIGGLISITEVDVSPDLRHAKVYVSVMGTEDEQLSTFQALHAAAPFLQRALRRRLTIRRTPELDFHPDDSMKRAAEILALLDRARSDQEPAS